MRKYAVIKGYLKHSNKLFNHFDEHANRVQAYTAYNRALKDIADFIEKYESGVLPKEFLDGLIEKSEEK